MVSNIFSHNIWDNPSHWLIFFKMVKTTNQYRCYISRYPKLRVQIAIVVAITSPSNNHSRGYSFQLFSIYDWGSQEGIHDLPIILSSYPLNGIKIHIFMIFHISYPTLSPYFHGTPHLFSTKKNEWIRLLSGGQDHRSCPEVQRNWLRDLCLGSQWLLQDECPKRWKDGVDGLVYF